MDRTSAVILGFGLPAILIFVVWATAGSIYQTTSAPPPRPAAEQVDEASEDTAAAEAPAEDAPAEEDTAEAEAPAEDAPSEEDTAAAEAPAEDAPAEEDTAAAEAPAEDAPAEEDTAEAEAPAEGAPAEEDTAEAGIDLAALVEAGDVRSGSRLWRQCSACHVADQEQNRVGPHLVDVIGREKASIDDFRYSEALTSLEGSWTADEMSAWLEDPREYAPGNRMTFNGLDDPQELADILAYLADIQLQNGS